MRPPMLAIAAMLLCAATNSFAQSKTPIYVTASVSDGDAVGNRLVFELKEAIRGSGGYRLVVDHKEWPYMRVSVVTLRTAASGTAAGYTIAYDSVDMPIRGALIFSGVQTCPAAATNSCARNMLAAVERALVDLQDEAPELRRTLR